MQRENYNSNQCQDVSNAIACVNPSFEYVSIKVVRSRIWCVLSDLNTSLWLGHAFLSSFIILSALMCWVVCAAMFLSDFLEQEVSHHHSKSVIIIVTSVIMAAVSMEVLPVIRTIQVFARGGIAGGPPGAIAGASGGERKEVEGCYSWW